MSHIPPNYPPRYESPSLTVRLQRAYREVRLLQEKLDRARNTMTNLHKGLRKFHTYHPILHTPRPIAARDLWLDIMDGIEEHIKTGKEMDFCLVSSANPGAHAWLTLVKGAVPTATGVAAPTRLPSISEQPCGVRELSAVTEATGASKDTLAVALNNHPLS